MRETVPDCVKCGGAMQTGYFVNHSRSLDFVASCVQGYPGANSSFADLFGGEKTVERKCVSFRCTKCGYLESYAI
jgi:hypothetical protein